MRVLVCGGRDYNDREHIHKTLCDLNEEVGPITCIIHGTQTGADHWGKFWAETMTKQGTKVAELPFAPQWNKYGKAAGPKRNARMLKEGKPELVVAFPGGKGTTNMIKQAKKAGIPVRQIPAQA